MKTEKMLNKENVVMTTKDGIEMIKNTLEENDKFVCLWNKPISEKKGESKFERYSIKVKILVENDQKEEFIDLTPTQYNVLLKVSEDKEQDDLNQHVFTCYKYADSFGGQSISCTNKVKKEAVNLE